MADYPNRVRRLRRDRSMTQATLARRARVTLCTVALVEDGNECRADTKRRLLLALGLRFEDMRWVFPESSHGTWVPPEAN